MKSCIYIFGLKKISIFIMFIHKSKENVIRDWSLITGSGEGAGGKSFSHAQKVLG